MEPGPAPTRNSQDIQTTPMSLRTIDFPTYFRFSDLFSGRKTQPGRGVEGASPEVPGKGSGRLIDTGSTLRVRCRAGDPNTFYAHSRIVGCAPQACGG